MKVAVLSSVFKRTPPAGYGGIERVVHTYVEAMVRRGHDVTLFATPGSFCSGRTVEVAGYDPETAPSGVTSLQRAPTEEPLYQALRAYLAASPVDVIHDWSLQNLYVQRHPEAFPFVISSCVPPPPGYKRQNVVAASAAHAACFEGDVPHVHYGLNLDEWRFSEAGGERFVHISKIARYKSQHEAILAARAVRCPLDICGNVENRTYHDLVVRPLVAISPTVRFVGEIRGTAETLAHARALVQTPRWLEVLPLVVLESLASGTPVIAFPAGGLPEQVDNGVNGFLVRDRREMAEAFGRIGEISRRACRETAENRFTVERMCRDYLEVYARVRDAETW